MGEYMYKHFHNRKGVLAPNKEMWRALREGEGLSEILNNFYSRVYEDPRLSGFFEGVTKDRAIEKQFSFLKSIFTGEKCYFGDHPKTAHHWMVITDELFDYREELMEQCLREYGLAEELIVRWRKMEEVFRSAIVKSKPFELSYGGVKRPVEGYFREKLEIGTVCDNCSVEVDIGTEVTCHVRTGKLYCSDCSQKLEINTKELMR
jgi:truncated hemoglobin YjbI